MQSTLNTSLFTQITPSEQEALSGGGSHSSKVKVYAAVSKAHALAVSIHGGDANAYAEANSNISIH